MTDHVAKVAFALFSGPFSRAIPVTTADYPYSGLNFSLPEPGVGIYVANSPVVLREAPLVLDDISADIGVLWWDVGHAQISVLPPREAGIILPTGTDPYVQHVRVNGGSATLSRLVLSDNDENTLCGAAPGEMASVDIVHPESGAPVWSGHLMAGAASHASTKACPVVRLSMASLGASLEVGGKSRFTRIFVPFQEQLGV